MRTEKRAIRFLKYLKEKLQKFIATNITWSRMVQESYRDTEVIKQFKAEVINGLAEAYASFMKNPHAK